MSETIIKKEGTLMTVIPEARLDTATSPLLKQVILPRMEGIEKIIVDFAGVEYISSAGLRVLLEIYQEMEDRGGSLRLINVRKSVMAVFRLVNFNEIVEVESAE